MEIKTEIKRNRYSVSIVYTSIENGVVSTSLMVFITSKSSKEEALGHAIMKFSEDMKGKVISNKVVLLIPDEVVTVEMLDSESYKDSGSGFIDKGCGVFNTFKVSSDFLLPGRD
jgi:hypothetical protein